MAILYTKQKGEKKMPFVISNGKFVLAKNGKFVTSNRPGIEYAFGGTAQGVAIGFCSATDRATYKQELITAGQDETRVNRAYFVNMSGTKVGTVDLYIVPTLADPDAPVHLMIRSSAGVWSDLYDGVIGSDGKITVTISEFGPIAGIDKDYLVSKDGGVLYNKDGDYLTSID